MYVSRTEQRLKCLLCQYLRQSHLSRGLGVWLSEPTKAGWLLAGSMELEPVIGSEAAKDAPVTLEAAPPSWLTLELGV